MRNKKINVIVAVAAVCFLALLCFFVWYIARFYSSLNEQESDFEQLADSVSDGDLTNKYAELYAQNSDMVGWLYIEGTTINYPVMQAKDNPNFYLNHSFEKKYSDIGTPYVQENCSVSSSDNIIIYGHHITGKRMFAALEYYKKSSFYEEHKVINFDVLDGGILAESREYEIIAVFKTSATSSGFAFYSFVNAESQEDFDAYVTECKALSLYDTGVSAEYGDKLLTLVTCEYSAKNGRLVVVAKKIN